MNDGSNQDMTQDLNRSGNRGRAQLPPQRRRSARRTSGLAAAAVLTVTLLGGTAACSAGRNGAAASSRGDGPSVSSGGAKAVAPGVAPAPGSSSASSAGDSAAAAGTSSGDSVSGAEPAAALLQQRRLILNTGLTLTVGNVQEAAGRVRSLTTASGGFVGDEQTDGTGHSARSALTLRIPASRLAAVTDQVAALGTVRSRSQTSDDVTQQSVDVASRLATQRASVARVRALLGQATKISDIVLIEGELSRRESSLESLEAQLKSLDDQVDLATLTVTLTAPGAPAPKPVHARTGFLAGLDHGWSAFVGSLVVALTVLGALLPFAVLLALVGVPARMAWRRRRSHLQPATAPES